MCCTFHERLIAEGGCVCVYVCLNPSYVLLSHVEKLRQSRHFLQDGATCRHRHIFFKSPVSEVELFLQIFLESIQLFLKYQNTSLPP